MTEITQLITAIGIAISAILSAYSLILAARNGRVLKDANIKIDEVHAATNGLTKRLEISAGIIGEAKGRAAGLVEGRADKE